MGPKTPLTLEEMGRNLEEALEHEELLEKARLLGTKTNAEVWAENPLSPEEQERARELGRRAKEQYEKALAAEEARKEAREMKTARGKTPAAGRALDEGGVEFFAALTGAPRPQQFAESFAAAGWNTFESETEPGRYVLQHTWADLEVDGEDPGSLTILGTILPERAPELEALLRRNSTGFAADVGGSERTPGYSMGDEIGELDL
jgi:hypothetical protein